MGDDLSNSIDSIGVSGNEENEEINNNEDKEENSNYKKISKNLISQILSLSNEDEDHKRSEDYYKSNESQLNQVLDEISDLIKTCNKNDFNSVIVKKPKLCELETMLKSIMVGIIKDKLNSNFTKINYESKLELLESERNLLVKEIQFISAKQKNDLLKSDDDRWKIRGIDNNNNDSSHTSGDETETDATQSDNEITTTATTTTTVLKSSSLGDGIPGKKRIQIVTGAKLRGSSSNSNHNNNTSKDEISDNLGKIKSSTTVISNGNLKFNNKFKRNYKSIERETEKRSRFVHIKPKPFTIISSPPTSPPQSSLSLTQQSDPLPQEHEGETDVEEDTTNKKRSITPEEEQEQEDQIQANILDKPKPKRTYKRRDIFQYYDRSATSSNKTSNETKPIENGNEHSSSSSSSSSLINHRTPLSNTNTPSVN